MRVYIWYEGRRLGDYDDVVSVECDGDTVEVYLSDEDESVKEWTEGEWDDFTVHG